MKAINPSTQARATLRMIKSTVKQFQSSVIDYNDPFHLTKKTNKLFWMENSRRRKNRITTKKEKTV